MKSKIHTTSIANADDNAIPQTYKKWGEKKTHTHTHKPSLPVETKTTVVCEAPRNTIPRVGSQMQEPQSGHVCCRRYHTYRGREREGHTHTRARQQTPQAKNRSGEKLWKRITQGNERMWYSELQQRASDRTDGRSFGRTDGVVLLAQV